MYLNRKTRSSTQHIPSTIYCFLQEEGYLWKLSTLFHYLVFSTRKSTTDGPGTTSNTDTISSSTPLDMTVRLFGDVTRNQDSSPFKIRATAISSETLEEEVYGENFYFCMRKRIYGKIFSRIKRVGKIRITAQKRGLFYTDNFRFCHEIGI